MAKQRDKYIDETGMVTIRPKPATKKKLPEPAYGGGRPAVRDDETRPPDRWPPRENSREPAGPPASMARSLAQLAAEEAVARQDAARQLMEDSLKRPFVGPKEPFETTSDQVRQAQANIPPEAMEIDQMRQGVSRTLGQPAMPPMSGQPAGQPGLLTIEEFADRKFPELRGRQMVPRYVNQQLREAYKLYVAHAQASEDLMGAKAQREDQYAQRSASDPRNIPGTLPGQMGYAELTNQPPEVRTRLEKLMGISRRRELTPREMLEGEAINELITGQPGRGYEAYRSIRSPGSTANTISESLRKQLFDPGLDGKNSEIANALAGLTLDKRKRPIGRIRGWLKAFEALTFAQAARTPRDLAVISEVMFQAIPSQEDVNAAIAKGEATAEDRAAIAQAAQRLATMSGAAQVGE